MESFRDPEAEAEEHKFRDDIVPDRSDAHRLLLHGIPCVIWGEVALAQYGAPTAVFDLFLLVKDPKLAAQCLEDAGHRPGPAIVDYGFIRELGALRRLHLTKGAGGSVDDWQPSYIALYLASGCRYDLPANTIKLTEYMPPLPALVDSIIDAWMDASSINFAVHLAVHLAYLRDGCSEEHDAKLISQLKPEHQEFYTEYLAETEPRGGVDRTKWRLKRDLILQSVQSLCPERGEQNNIDNRIGRAHR